MPHHCGGDLLHGLPLRNVLAGQGLKEKNQFDLRSQTQDVASGQETNRSSSESTLGQMAETEERLTFSISWHEQAMAVALDFS